LIQSRYINLRVMKNNELLEKVVDRELDNLSTLAVLRWAIKRVEYIVNVLYTKQCGIDDTPENDVFLSILAHAEDYARWAANNAAMAMYYASRNVSGERGKDKQYFYDLGNIQETNLRDEVFDLDLRLLVDSKTRIYDFVTLQLRKRADKMAKHDKMSGYLVSFFSELDKFEEELYNVI